MSNFSFSQKSSKIIPPSPPLQLKNIHPCSKALKPESVQIIICFFLFFFQKIIFFNYMGYLLSDIRALSEFKTVYIENCFSFKDFKCIVVNWTFQSIDERSLESIYRIVFNLLDRNNLKNWRWSAQTEICFQ